MWCEDVEDVIFRTSTPFKFRFFQPDIMTWFDLGVSTMEEQETAWFMVQPEMGFKKGIYRLIAEGDFLFIYFYIQYRVCRPTVTVSSPPIPGSQFELYLILSQFIPRFHTSFQGSCALYPIG